MDLVQFRRNHGDIEFRQRQPEQGYWPQYITADYPPWGPWTKFDAVKGDESDAEKWGNE